MKKESEREEIKNRVCGQAYLENYALKIFTHADKQDREGKATKATVKLFYTASVLIEVCSQFGSLNTELAEKLKYAKYKTVYLTKCINEGITPQPGPPDAEDEQKQEVSKPNGLEASPNYRVLPEPKDREGYPPLAHFGSTEAVPPAASQSISSLCSITTDLIPKRKEDVSTSDISNVDKNLRSVRSALQFEDIEAAVKHLKLALDILTVSPIRDHHSSG
jgi:vacuolar protein sorting-associated protein VTA1